MQFSYNVNAILLVINTFHACLWPILFGVRSATLRVRGRGWWRRTVQWLSLLQLMRSWLVVCAMVAAAIFRRHLMVWGLFAPKVVFEMAFGLVTDALVLVALGVAGVVGGGA